MRTALFRLSQRRTRGTPPKSAKALTCPRTKNFDSRCARALVHETVVPCTSPPSQRFADGSDRAPSAGRYRPDRLTLLDAERRDVSGDRARTLLAIVHDDFEQSRSTLRDL